MKTRLLVFAAVTATALTGCSTLRDNPAIASAVVTAAEIATEAARVATPSPFTAITGAVGALLLDQLRRQLGVPIVAPVAATGRALRGALKR